jgi:hypothetical protein
MSESYLIGLNCDLEKLERSDFSPCIEEVITGIWYSHNSLQEKLETFNTLLSFGNVTRKKLSECETVLSRYSLEESTTNVERSFLAYIRLKLNYQF